MSLAFYCTHEAVPMHYFEAMQVFSHIYGLPLLVTGLQGQAFVSRYVASLGLPADTDAVLAEEVPDDAVPAEEAPAEEAGVPDKDPCGTDEKYCVPDKEPALACKDPGLACIEFPGVVRAFPMIAGEARKAAEEDCELVRRNPALMNDRNMLKRHLYKTLSDVYGYKSPWGVLTGVRPTKVVHKLIAQGFTEAQAEAHLRDFYCCSEGKIRLCMDTFRNQRHMLGYRGKDCGLYVAFPFCPSICSYCTFGSSPIERYRNKVDAYKELLLRELELSAELLSGRYNVKYIYVGGGTPTAVPANVLREVLGKVSELFDTDSLVEYSVEAGRPDSIDAEKLEIIRNAGARRISINPQSMNAKTLELVGRRHTPEDIVEKVKLAKSMGFANVNMDVIAGLPGETPEDFRETMKQVIGLDPEGITVHTLSLKRASQLAKNESVKTLIDVENAGRMADLSREMTVNAGYEPFYMYRQKNCIGNNENVSYCKKGFESPYNVHIMDEDLTIVGVGAGAVTKIVSDGGAGIRRFFNAKSPDEYMRSFDVVVARKREALGDEKDPASAF